MTPGRGRRLAVRALVVLASVVLLLALLAGYVRRAGVDSDQFANRATAALRDDSVRTLVAERITDDVVLAKQADLLAARPIIESVAGSVVASRGFTNLFRAAVRDVHRSVFNRETSTVTLTLADVGTVLGAALAQVRPEVASEVEATGRVSLVKRDVGDLSAKLAGTADSLRLLALLLLVAGLALVAGALALARDRRRTAVELGIGIAAGGVVLIVAYGVARSLALDHVEGAEARAAAGAVWDAFLGDLRTAAWIYAGAGALIAAAAASLLKPVDIAEPLRRAGRWLATEPQRPALRALRGAGLVAAGVTVVVARDAVLSLLLAVAGAYLVYEGMTVLLRLIYRPPAPGEEQRSLPALSWRRLATVLIPAAVIALALTAFVGGGGVSTAAPAAGTCNGHDELCGRTLPDVVLPATHNSMSVPLPGWYASVQEKPIAGQLADGVRGLLIDTHYADRLAGGNLRTYFGSPEELRRQAAQDGVNPDAVDAAMRIRERIGFAGEGERGMYLCHSFCELGGTSLESVLDDVHDFLVANPDEVLVVINQDYLTPADFVGAVRDAGLEPFAYRGPFSGRWLTLRQMIDSNQRVVFLAENHAGAAPWYRPVYDTITEETPYSFSRPAQLTDRAGLAKSCEPNRGPEGAPLFLVNHWITTDPVPLPSHASQVNAYDPLLARARECQRLRKHLTNLLAVNFYRRGDLFRVVDTLNGVR